MINILKILNFSIESFQFQLFKKSLHLDFSIG